MENQETQTGLSSVNHAMKQGVILGVVLVVLLVVFYAIDIAVLASIKFMLLSLLVSLGYVIYAGIQYRGSIGGFMGYGQALQHGFVIMAVSGLVSTAFNLVLYTVVDPALGQKMSEAIIQNTQEMMAGFGAPQQSIDETIDDMREDLADQFSVTGLLIGYGKGLIYFLIVALVSALFVRKNKPVI